MVARLWCNPCGTFGEKRVEWGKAPKKVPSLLYKKVECLLPRYASMASHRRVPDPSSCPVTSMTCSVTNGIKASPWRK